MNYTVIIILIVLLFVIYKLKTNEKKEGFVTTYRTILKKTRCTRPEIFADTYIDRRDGSRIYVCNKPVVS
jgi:hypothetical protein